MATIYEWSYFTQSFGVASVTKSSPGTNKHLLYRGVDAGSIYRSQNLRVDLEVRADSWPQVFEDINARKDWGWKHEYGLEELCSAMIDVTKPYYTE
ncbi:UNVERIFIED_CONTAM: L-threonine 3-dehydrogenase [Trichonephila clavipes]